MARMQSNCNSHTLLVRMQNGIATVKTAWQFFIKLNIHLSYGPVIPLVGMCPREMEIITLYLNVNVYVLSWAQLFVTPWTVACQAPPSMRILQARILE